MGLQPILSGLPAKGQLPLQGVELGVQRRKIRAPSASPPVRHGAAAPYAVLWCRGSPRGPLPFVPTLKGEVRPPLRLAALGGSDARFLVSALPRDHAKYAQAVVRFPTELQTAEDEQVARVRRRHNAADSLQQAELRVAEANNLPVEPRQHRSQSEDKLTEVQVELAEAQAADSACLATRQSPAASAEGWQRRWSQHWPRPPAEAAAAEGAPAEVELEPEAAWD